MAEEKGTMEGRPLPDERYALEPVRNSWYCERFGQEARLAEGEEGRHGVI